MTSDAMPQQRWLQISTDEVVSEPAPDISPVGFAISAVPVVIVLLISLSLRLGNVQVLIIAAIRCVAQLMILGLILYPVFVNNQPYVVLPYIFIMVVFATREATVKPKHRYRGMGWHMLLSLTVGLSISFAIITGLVLRPNPWWNASVMIPLCGMLMGSSVNALSLGMDKLLLSLSDSGGRGSARLQTYLACGATSWEASLPSVREAIETGLTPNLNQMSIMGLVSIPGMMAGQILGGASPLVAAKYQVVIMFFICSNSTTVLLGAIVQAVFWCLFDAQHRFQSNRVLKRTGGKPKDIVLAFIHFVCGALGFVPNITKDNGEDCPMDSVTTRRESLMRKWSSTHRSHEKRNIKDGMKRGTFVAEPGQMNTSKLLHLKNGEVVYPNSLHLSSLEVVINEGDIVLIKGESGCGKSTLLRSLALFEPLGRASSIELKGHSVESLGGSPIWRAEVCYIRQQGGQGLRGTPIELLNDLCHLHSQQNRLSGEKNTTVSAAHVESKAQKHMEALMLPTEMLLRRWDELSGGESQRVYLCIMLALQPSICLLDEPTSALDDQNSKMVEKLLLDSKITLVWVTHNMDQVERLEQDPRTKILQYRDLTSIHAQQDEGSQLNEKAVNIDVNSM